MLSVFLGIMTATLLIAAAPVYLDALERQSINGAVESAVARDGEGYFTITVRSSFIPLEAREIEGTDADVSDAGERERRAHPHGDGPLPEDAVLLRSSCRASRRLLRLPLADGPLDR